MAAANALLRAAGRNKLTVHALSGRDKLTEDVLEIVIPFMVMESPAHTMCGPKEGRTPICKTGEHVHVWCRNCAELPIDHHCGATHDACPDCRTLRTIIPLSRRWEEYMWGRMEHVDVFSFPADIYE